MTKWVHLLALANAVIGLGVLLGWLALTGDQIAGLMGTLALLGSFLGAFFDPKVPWFGAQIDVEPKPEPPPGT